MIKIRFPDESTERRGLGYLAARFAFKTWNTGVTVVPDEALAALANEGFSFSVEGPATDEYAIKAVRAASAAAV